MVFSPLHCRLVWVTVCRLKFDAIPHLHFCCFLSFWFHIENSSNNNKNPCPSQWLRSFRSFDLICGVCLERREQSYPCTQMLFSSVILWRGCPSYLTSGVLPISARWALPNSLFSLWFWLLWFWLLSLCHRLSSETPAPSLLFLLTVLWLFRSFDNLCELRFLFLVLQVIFLGFWSWLCWICRHWVYRNLNTELILLTYGMMSSLNSLHINLS